MDEQKSGAAVNGAKGSAGSRQNDPEAKVNKTLLLKMQIEENRYSFFIVAKLAIIFSLCLQ